MKRWDIRASLSSPDTLAEYAMGEGWTVSGGGGIPYSVTLYLLIPTPFSERHIEWMFYWGDDETEFGFAWTTTPAGICGWR